MRASTSCAAVKPTAPSATGLAGLDEPLGGREGVFERRCARSRRVEVEHVDAIGPQAGEGCLDRADEIDGAEARVVGVPADADGEHDLVAQATRVQPLPDDVLAAAAGEAVGGVQRVAAALDVGVHDLVAGFEVDVPAELGAAEDQREDLGTGLAERHAHALADRRALHGDRRGRMHACRPAGAIGRLSEETAEPTPNKAMCHPLTSTPDWSLRDFVSPAPPGAYFEGKPYTDTEPVIPATCR